ncbi:MAG: protein translocase subunit SecD [Lachnospiraceae bacterium]|nr:protein translocase subunit SecD [Lachnospiraceae bacterium]
MKNKKNQIGLIVLIILLIVGVYTVFYGVDANKTGSAANIKQGLDLAGGVSITYQVVGEENPSREDMSDTIYKLQKRVEAYSTEAQVYQEGSDRINIEIPGVTDANAILEELGKPGSLSFLDKDGNEVLTGTDIADAQAGTQKDNMGNSSAVVSLIMTKEGAEKFREATTVAAVNHDIIYIVYDEQVVSAPSVREAITDGQAVISGMADYDEADILASTIRIGGLKLELEELRSNVVGAQLGNAAIATSLKAGGIGLALVMIFMVVVYFVPGIASALALAIYVVAILLLLNGFDITLTLPGIAGIILSIGMAVDANVIIFARIREEIAEGISVKAAIAQGFKKALSAILDGNITTLIAAAVLGWLGSGSVKGFAQTLALGIVVSMVTALFVTRIILNAFYELGLKDEKYYGKAKTAKTFDFLSKKAIFFVLSLVIIAGGFITMGINKNATGDILNYSLDFKGGTATSITFNEDLSIEDIEKDVVPVVEEVAGGSVQTQKVQGTNEVIIKTRTLSVEERKEMEQALVDQFGVNEELITAETISSTISSEMRSDALLAVIVATVCMLIYIAIRFHDIRFGASSVIALIHDVLVVLAVYAVVKVSVGSTFIACMLTIVGYSINATIVIFDRIRENMAVARKKDLKEIVNISINQTLSRSIFTSLTTFIMVALLYVMGVTSIKEFALPLMAGIFCGTYSSICLAGALWYVLKTKVAANTKKN